MRRNSLLLILSQAVLAGCMFLFFVISAHLFSASEVGLAASFISLGLLVATFTNLGLPNTIIRFMPTAKRKAGLFTAATGLVTLSSILGGLIAVTLINHLAPKLSFVQDSTLLSVFLILLVFGSALSTVFDGTLIAFRKGEYVFIKSLLTNLPRIILPFSVVAAGVKGMTGIYVITLLVGILFNAVVILRWLLKSEPLRPTLGVITKHRAYAASNYFSGMFGVLPSTLVPIIVLNQLGPAAAAYYYMPAQIALFLSMVCNSISQAFISEASQTDDPQQHRILFRKTLKHQYQLLIPIVLVLCIIGWPLLHIYGSVYAVHGYVPLLILAASSLVVGLNWLGDTWLNVKKRSRDYLLMNAFNSLAVVAFVYLFSRHGLAAAAVGWLCGQLVSAVVYLAIFARSQLLTAVSGLRGAS